MPRNITVTFDDGTSHTYQNAPDSVTPEQIAQRAGSEFGKGIKALDGGRKAEAQTPDSVPANPWEGTRARAQSASANILGDTLGNLSAGAIRGAGSIGATILAPIDAAARALNGGKPINVGGYDIAGQDRRAGMDAGLQSLGADPESLAFKGGKMGAEIAGTAGVGGALAQGITRAVPAAAGAVPGLLDAITTGGMSSQGANLATRTAGAAINGGASAGLIDPKDASMGAMIGGALPGAAKIAGAAGNKIGSAITGGGVSPEVAALANRAKSLGIDIPLDRLVQSKPLDAVASGLNYVPFSGRAATEAKMSTQLNQALSRTFGENSSNVTQALRTAEGRLGGQFDSFLKSNTVAVDQQFMQDLADSANQAGRELGSDGASIISKQIDDIIAKAGSGQIDGQAAYNIKKTLDRIGNRNSPEAWYAIDLKKKLMEALNRSVGPQQAQEFAQLRQHYGNMLDLQKLAKNGVDGELSVARIANLKNINNQPLQEIADIAAQFVKPREGQHGAMQRAVVGMGSASIAGPLGLAAGATAGRAANGLLNSSTLRNMALGQPNALQSLVGPQAQQLAARSLPGLLASPLGAW